MLQDAHKFSFWSMLLLELAIFLHSKIKIFNKTPIFNIS